MTDVLERAKAMEERGEVVIPVHSVGPDGKTCSCMKGANCRDAGKHPIGDEWEKRRDGISFLEELVEKGRKPNLGILVSPSNLVIVDIDPRNGGDVTMADFVKKYGAMPRTRIKKTGADGWHYYFRAPEGVSLKGKLGPGVDLKSSGMVVAEGSRSYAGEYSVLVDAEPCDLPQWIIDEAEKPTYERQQPEPAPVAAVDPDDPDLPRRQAYCTSAIMSDLAKLDALEAAKVKGWSKDNSNGYQGDDWNQTTYNVACNVLEFANTPEAGLSMKEAIDLILDHAPRDEEFGDAEILKCVESARDRVGSTGRDIPPPPINPFGEALAAGGDSAGALDRMDGRPWKDAHVADAFCEHHVDMVRYVPGLGWLVWSPMRGVWEEVDDALMIGLSANFAKALAGEAAARGDADLVKTASSRLTAAAIGNVVSLAKGDRAVRCAVSDLDADPELLNCTNGYVDLRTGNLIEHNPDKMMTKMTGCAYRPGATHPDLDKALEALDPDEREWLQMIFGQAITGYPLAEDFLLMLHGVGANGKSALIGTLMEVAGSYATMLTERVIISQKAAHSTDMTDLLGARVAVLEELPEAGNLSSKHIKNIVGTPELRARKMFQDNITWKATHTIFITTNHLPRITETDHGLWRRLAILTFPYRFVPTPEAIENENDRLGDLGLRQRLTRGPQKEAFLAWVVEGARKYLALEGEPFGLTPKMAVDKEEWRHGMDPTGRFLEEMVEFDPAYCIPGSDLYDELKVWLGQNGHAPWSSQLATSRLEQHHEVLNHNAKRVRLTVGKGVSISYRPGPVQHSYADGQKVRVWQGMKWKEGA